MVTSDAFGEKIRIQSAPRPDEVPTSQSAQHTRSHPSILETPRDMAPATFLPAVHVNVAFLFLCFVFPAATAVLTAARELMFC